MGLENPQDCQNYNCKFPKDKPFIIKDNFIIEKGTLCKKCKFCLLCGCICGLFKLLIDNGVTF